MLNRIKRPINDIASSCLDSPVLQAGSNVKPRAAQSSHCDKLYSFSEACWQILGGRAWASELGLRAKVH